jgi:hypothetical protein
MKRTVLMLQTAALLLLCATITLGQQKYTLAYHFQPGMVYSYADTSLSKQTQEMMGQEMKITTKTITKSHLLGEGVKPDGAMTVVSALDSMTMAMKSPMRDTTMVVGELLGKRTRLTLSAQGAVIAREVIDSIKAKGMMGSAVSMREFFRFHRFSKDQVSVGSTWKSDAADSSEMMGGKMVSRTKMDYTVLAAAMCEGRSCLQIGFKGEITIDGKGSMMGMDLFMEGKGKVSGTVMFDPAQGVVVHETSATDTDMTAAVTGQQNMTIPITANVNLSKWLLSVEGAAK